MGSQETGNQKFCTQVYLLRSALGPLQSERKRGKRISMGQKDKVNCDEVQHQTQVTALGDLGIE